MTEVDGIIAHRLPGGDGVATEVVTRQGVLPPAAVLLILVGAVDVKVITCDRHFQTVEAPLLSKCTYLFKRQVDPLAGEEVDVPGHSTAPSQTGLSATCAGIADDVCDASADR